MVVGGDFRVLEGERKEEEGEEEEEVSSFSSC